MAGALPRRQKPVFPPWGNASGGQATRFPVRGKAFRDRKWHLLVGGGVFARRDTGFPRREGLFESAPTGFPARGRLRGGRAAALPDSGAIRSRGRSRLFPGHSLGRGRPAKRPLPALPRLFISKIDTGLGGASSRLTTARSQRAQRRARDRPVHNRCLTISCGEAGLKERSERGSLSAVAAHDVFGVLILRLDELPT